MRPTKQFERWLRDPEIDSETIHALEEYECEVCGAELVHEWFVVYCTPAHSEHQGLCEYWHQRYDVCPDCEDAGVASFPDRLRKHAQELEERVRQLRELADAKWHAFRPDDAKAYRTDNELGHKLVLFQPSKG